MNLANKTFKDNRTGEIIKVRDHFENIAILENKEKVDVRRLMDNNYYTEQIDPSTFFNNQNSYNTLADKIKNIPDGSLPTEEGEISTSVKIDNTYIPEDEESAIIYSTIDDEKAEMARKYGIDSFDNTNKTNESAISKQNDAFSKILNEQDEEERLRAEELGEEYVQKVVVDRNEIKKEINYTSENQFKQEDPIITMFKGVKRSVEFNLDLKLENKIPRLDFIEMMEDSYERSIIEFLAEEFTNELLKDPRVLKETIANKIREIVYDKKPTKRVVKKAVKPVAKKPVRKRTPKVGVDQLEVLQEVLVKKSRRKATPVSETDDKKETENK